MNNFIEHLSLSPFFGLCLSIGTYQLALLVQRKLKSNLFNPLLISTILICFFLYLSGIKLENYQNGAKHISILLGPCTVALGLSIYQQKEKLKQYFWAILAASLLGSLVSIVSVLAFCKIIGLDEQTALSLTVKSVTTPIAASLSENLGGNTSLTVLAVVLTGILGAVSSPFLIKISGIKDKVAIGLGIGVSSHALGTSRALTIGEIEGAMSSLAIGTAGLATVFWILVLF